MRPGQAMHLWRLECRHREQARSHRRKIPPPEERKILPTMWERALPAMRPGQAMHLWRLECRHREQARSHRRKISPLEEKQAPPTPHKPVHTVGVGQPRPLGDRWAVSPLPPPLGVLHRWPRGRRRSRLHPSWRCSHCRQAGAPGSSIFRFRRHRHRGCWRSTRSRGTNG